MSKKRITDNLNLKIEETISGMFAGEYKVSLLNFIAYLRENKMNPSRSSAVSYKIICKGFVVGYFRVNKAENILQITPFLDVYDENAISDDIKEIVWANNTGLGCGEGCHQCNRLNMVFGKAFDDACYQCVTFNNPDGNELECIIKLLVLRRDTIRSGEAKCGIPINYGNK